MPDTAGQVLAALNVGSRPTIRSVIRAALELYRAEPVKVSVAAVITFAPIDVITVLLHGISAHLLELGHTGFAVGALYVSFFLVTSGQVFLAGVYDHMMAASLENKPILGVGEVYRRLPLGRLLVADFAVSIIVSVAALFLLVPGVIAFALLGIVGPVINIENRGIVDALRRSAVLVRPHIWMACILVVLPFWVEFAVEHWFQSFSQHVPWVVILSVSLALSITLRSMVSLFEVVLGHALIRRYPAPDIRNPHSPEGGVGEPVPA